MVFRSNEKCDEIGIQELISYPSRSNIWHPLLSLLRGTCFWTGHVTKAPI